MVSQKSASPEGADFKNFIFVSELYKDDVSEEFGRVYAVARAAEDGTLIGVDENAGGDQFQELVRRLGTKRVGFSLYLDGPGGPTGEDGEYQPDELRRIVRRAEKYCESPITDPHEDGFLSSGQPSLREVDYEGYTTEELDHLGWMEEWNREGWVKYFKQESLPLLRGKSPFLGGEPRVFAATEIDNLYRHLEASHKDFQSFLNDLEGWIRTTHSSGELDLRLVLKNLNYDAEGFDKIEGLKAYAEQHGTELFVGYHIAEADSESFLGRQELERQLEPLGIRTIVSTDTNDYLASSKPNLVGLLRDRERLRELERRVASQAQSDDGL